MLESENMVEKKHYFQYPISICHGFQPINTSKLVYSTTNNDLQNTLSLSKTPAKIKEPETGAST
jgi:hypothetical protein